MKLKVPCPAKINTFLAVGPKDARGYHPLRTIFQTIGLFDELTISTEGESGIFCDWSDLPKENTLTKALRLLQEVVSLPPLSIYLSKRIPTKSGLGGGSSDAAGLIRGVAKLFPGIPKGEMHAIAAAVGADVPFFLVGGRARAEGYGERLTPLPDAPSRHVLIALPEGVECSTFEMYARLDEQSYSWRDLPVNPDEVYNDFERVAPCECLDLIKMLKSKGASQAGLTGSGSACFGIFESIPPALNGSFRTFIVAPLSRAESVGSMPCDG